MRQGVTGTADTPPGDVTGLLEAATLLREALDGVRLALQTASVDEARRTRQGLLDQLDDYVLPRLRTIDAPLLAVVGGSTGAGKSTLVNSLIGRVVSVAGVLRPTTRSPVLVHHPDDTRWFADQRVLPSLARVTGDDLDPLAADDRGIGRVSAVRLVPDAAVAAGLAILDAPDIDSIVDTNREMASQLLAAADLWLFVTTAARYADAVPWEMLHTAVDRGTTVAVVLDRVPPAALQEVRAHLAGMLVERGLGAAPVFTIVEAARTQGLLTPGLVEPLRQWLSGLAGSSQARGVVVRRTLTGALARLPERALVVSEAAAAQGHERDRLTGDVQSAWDGAHEAVEEALRDGTLLRGEVLARWQELVGTGDLFRSLESGVSRLRDRVTAALRGRTMDSRAEPLGEALQTGVQALVRSSAADAEATTVHRWRERDAGPALLAARGEQTGLSADFDERLARTVRDWQAGILTMVRTEGEGKKAGARALSVGVNGTGAVLMLVVFAGTGGLTGAEVGIAAGTAVLAQRLLEAVFGDQAVRGLAARARTDLLDRVDGLLEVERARWTRRLDPTEAAAAQSASVRQAVERLRRHLGEVRR